jgi:hypothetical protein
MTWAKFPTELPSEARRDQLSRDEYILFVDAWIWLSATEDDRLRVPRHMLPVITMAGSPEVAAAGLVKRKWFRAVGEDWAIRHHADLLRDSLAASRATRARNRRSQAARRAREQDSTAPGPDQVSADVSADVSGAGNYLTNYLEHPAREDKKPDAVQRPKCAVPGCAQPARQSCLTCAGHMTREPEFTGAGDMPW